ncbi:MAG: macro domain-containing protein [Pseudobdellovibrio sp.]
MIYEVTGDILKTKAGAIAHGIASNDHFNQGLALSLKENWPSLAKDFRHYCHTQNPKAGTVWSWMGSDGKKIINLLTQEAADSEKQNPHKATLQNVAHALKQLKIEIEKDKIKSIAIPKLATGVGGLAWEDVRDLIYKNLNESSANVYIYTKYQKDVEATEV